MNKEHILSEARKIFSDLAMVKEDIYKGQLRIEDKTAGLYFLDLHGSVHAKDFKTYQEEVLASEYYDQEDSLQWNLYFLLIADEVNDTDRQVIECDEKYARKYIFTENEFIDFFTLDRNTSIIQSDIVTVWKKKLGEAGLPQVYGSGTFVSGVNDFIANKSIASIVSRKKVNSDILKINFINKLTLQSSYRAFPLIRKFDFGKVNLFRGPNGVGKTSVLEAIELTACGKTKRNFGYPEQDQCIEAIVNDSVKEICTPSNNEKYRYRDLDWYNNDYASGNQICQSFNRFNFFDSDAANNFSVSNSEEEVKKALERLILGPEFKYLKDRVNGFYTRLKPKLNEIRVLISEAKLKVKNAENILAKGEKENNSVELLFNDLRKKAEEIEFVSEISLKDENLGELDIVINKVKAQIDRILTSVKDTNIASDKQVQSQLELIKSQFAALDKYQNDTRKFSSTAKNSQALMEITLRKLEALAKLKSLLEKPALLGFQGSKERLVTYQTNLRKMGQIEKELAPLVLDSLTEAKDINLILSDGWNKIQTQQSELAAINEEIAEKLRLLNDLERVVRETREKGKEILLLDEDRENCPVCDTHFEKGELIKKIDSLINNNNNQKGNSQSSSLVTKKVEKDKQIAELKSYVENVQRVQNAYQIAFDGKPDKQILPDVLLAIQSFISARHSIESSMSELANLIELGKENNFSEDSIGDLKTIISNLFENSISIGVEQLQKVNELINELELSKESYEKEHSEAQIEVENCNQELRAKFGLKESDPINAEQQSINLKNEEAHLHSLMKAFEELHQIIRFDENSLLSDLKARTEEIQMCIASLRQAMSADNQLSQAKSDLEKGNSYLKQNEKYFKRLEKGVGTLEDLSNKGGDSELTEFFNSNFKQILEIFKTIHAPREFQDLRYNSGEIDVVDYNGELRRVSQISTGQRAALAISIFISMNRMLKNGPNLVIFDDPVSHVDDLNTLSFLDFLRIFILREKKQIFFSTANSRLAALFKKKFSFLGSELKEWDLRREIVSPSLST